MSVMSTKSQSRHLLIPRIFAQRHLIDKVMGLSRNCLQTILDNLCCPLGSNLLSSACKAEAIAMSYQHSTIVELRLMYKKNFNLKF